MYAFIYYIHIKWYTGLWNKIYFFFFAELAYRKNC